MRGPAQQRPRLPEDPDLVPGDRLDEFIGRIPVRIHSHQHGSGRKTDARTSHKLRVDSFVLGHLKNLVAERILADR